jgi:parallel beta-helix repeat protein
MKMIYQGRTALFALFGVAVVGVISAWAADCGDTAGPGGTRVACACGDTMVTDTVLRSTDPVVSTGPGDVCPGAGLRFGAPDLTLDCKGLTLHGTGEQVSGIHDGAQPGGTIQGCGVVGFFWGIVAHGTGTSVVNSKAVGNYQGINLFRRPSQRAERNQVEGNTIGLVVAFESSASVVTQNRAIGNWYGIYVDAADNRFSANITDGNFAAGLRVAGTGNVLEGNRGKDNGWHGIVVYDPGNTLRRNVYDTNAGHGICAVAGNIDGGANRGTGNTLQPDVEFNCQ